MILIAESWEMMVALDAKQNHDSVELATLIKHLDYEQIRVRGVI